MKMMALSVRQPWADLLFLPEGADPEAEEPPKTIETRDWPRGLVAQAEALIGKRIAIHASKTVDVGACYQLVDYGVDLDLTDLAKMATGCLIGTVLVERVRVLTEDDEEAALCECEGKIGLCFCDARRLAEPIPWRGQLAFFPVEVPEGA